MATLARPAPGRILGERYQVREVLGRGGMGEVFRAFDLKLRVEVALKAVRVERASERTRELLRGEVRTAREVVSPNVCRIFDLVVEDGQELVSMEYIDGVTLGETLRTRGPLELGEAREIASQFLSGLEAIHQAGLVHRDFKPENVMLTRAGRVVVMDFGLAKARSEEGTGTVSGTPAYMSPEQGRGESLDARADVYAAGVVLAEMLSVGGSGAFEARQALWRGVREVPPRVPEGPWADVLRQALSPIPEERPASARALARSLEEVTQRLPGFETRRPYPGLSSFTEEDAEYFFGREVEVEAVWRKLKRPRMLALIAPSGAGKSSFLRAGLLPTLPKGWKALITTPGNRPFQALARALAPAFAGDAQAVEALLRFEEEDTAVSLLHRFRQRHEHALLVLDQFEELFTLNPPKIQEAFASLLGRLVLEADLHVILSLRDDFLFRCHDHDALLPAFSDLTPLGTLSESGLRRALVQPALSCGYRFEDETLVEEMVGEVQKERGALPLLAFAASRLWEMRDREKGLLTREAYGQIGGVGGALAQHAEATLERIGAPRTPLVREIFRNLVTAQGTRAVREREELLSVFARAGDTTTRAREGDSTTRAGEADSASRSQAEEVLNALVDARLLTSYERPGEGGESHHQIEIIHESLLANWPRLVRWQTQDADGAQLRDQLRQAAQLWQDRGQTEDLLWSGQAYQDFALWRQRYPAPLTAAEDAFAVAMTARATRQKRRRRALAVGAIALATTVAIVTSVLWHRADKSRQQAEAEIRQREAAELLALGRLRLEDYPSGALAFAIASLERADNAPARRFALEALWRGPTVSVLKDPINPLSARWSPDDRWLAVGATSGFVVLDGQSMARHSLATAGETAVGFSHDSTRLVSRVQSGTVFHVWSLPEPRLLDTLDLPGADAAFLFDRRLLTFHPDPKAPVGHRPTWIRERSIDDGAERTIGLWRPRALSDWDLDRTGEWLTSVQGGRVLRQRLDALDAPPKELGRHEGNVGVWGHDWSDRFVTSDPGGELRLWNIVSEQVERTLRSPADALRAALDPAGRFIASAPGGLSLPTRSFALFDLEAPRVADPVLLTQKETDYLNSRTFHPQGKWLASGHSGSLLFWNLVGHRPIVVRGQMGVAIGLMFTSDGRLLSTSDEGVVQAWNLSSGAQGGARKLWSQKDALVGYYLAVSDGGAFAVIVRRFQGRVIKVPLDGSPATEYPLKGHGHGPALGSPSIDSTGRRLAIGYVEFGNPSAGSIRILDFATGQEQILETSDTTGACQGSLASFGPSGDPWWLPDGRLVSEGASGLRLWRPETGTSQQLRACRPVTVNKNAIQVETTADAHTLVELVSSGAHSGGSSDLTTFDLDTGVTREITSHGTRPQVFALDPTGKILVTGDADGLVRVGPLFGDSEPHLLYGHTRAVSSVKVSPDGRWIASGGDDGTIRLWPMPEGPPLHTLPYEALLAKLHSLTNLRALPDPTAPTGYKLEPGPLSSWATAPVW